MIIFNLAHNFMGLGLSLRLVVIVVLSLNTYGLAGGKFSTAHGIVMGKGNTSYNGVHIQDSLSFKIKQNISSGVLYESISGSINNSLNSKTIQDGSGDLSIGYKKNGYRVTTNLGLSYATVIYNKQSRKESLLQKSGSKINPTWGLSLSKATVFSADSSWDWNVGTYYDETQNQFRTIGASTSLQKTWDEFDLTGSFSTYHQNQPNNMSTASIGYGAQGVFDWTGDANYFSVTFGMDLQFANSLQRILVSGVAYTYSPCNWLDFNFMASRELNLDTDKNAKLWLVGTSVRLNF